MKIRNRRVLRIAVTVLVMQLIAVVAGYVYNHSSVPVVNRAAGLLRSIIFFSIIIAWAFSIVQRIIHKKIRTLLLIISALLVYWFVARSMRYLFVIQEYGVYRVMWYSYYIPMLCIPVVGILIALYMGKSEDYKLPRWTYFLYIPTLTLLLLVLTNDLHELVFVFTGEMEVLKGNYVYNFGFWLIFFWIAVSAVGMLTILIIKNRIKRSKKKFLLPFAPVLAYMVYALAYALRFKFVLVWIGDVTAVFSFAVMGLFELSIQAGLIRPNTNYAKLLYSSGIAVQIVDEDYQVHYHSETAQALSKQVMMKAQGDYTMLDEHTRLSSVAIKGGHALWVDDVSQMNQLLIHLKEIGELLEEDNYLLQAELELKERKAAVDEKTRLYDRVVKETASQLKTLDTLLSEQHTDEMPLLEKLKWICVLGTFIKRRSNLVILSEDEKILSLKELEYCILESVETLSACNISASFNRDLQASAKSSDILLLYDLFEEIVEKHLSTLTDFYISAIRQKDLLVVKLQMQCNNGSKDEALKKYGTAATFITSGGKIHQKQEDGTIYITIEKYLEGAVL